MDLASSNACTGIIESMITATTVCAPQCHTALPASQATRWRSHIGNFRSVIERPWQATCMICPRI